MGVTGRSYYYYGISPQEDATIETTYATKQGPLLGGEYRDRMEYGKFVFSGSVAEGADQYGPSKNYEDPDKTVRGHIFGLGVYDLDDNWRSGFNIARTTDDTFLREYGYSDQDVLDNRLYTEGFFDRDYAVVNIYDAQDLRPGEVGTQPLALPYSNYQSFRRPGRNIGWPMGSQYRLSGPVATGGGKYRQSCHNRAGCYASPAGYGREKRPATGRPLFFGRWMATHLSDGRPQQ